MHSPVLRFGLKLGGAMALFYGLASTPLYDRMLYGYLRANAWLSNLVLTCLGQDSHVLDLTIRSEKFAITVRRGCDAIEPSWFFCAAVLAFPSSGQAKLRGLLAGVLLLQAMNLLRIASLFLIGLKYPPLFQTAHLEIWPVLFLLAATALWLGWIRSVRSGDAVRPWAAA